MNAYGVLGKFLGWFGITQRIERKAEARLNEQLSKLRGKVDELSRQVGKEKSMQRQHRVTEDALKSLKKALSASAEDYPHLRGKDALEKHFRYIQDIIEKSESKNDLEEKINIYLDSLSNKSEQSRKNSNNLGFEIDP